MMLDFIHAQGLSIFPNLIQFFLSKPFFNLDDSFVKLFFFLFEERVFAVELC